MHHEVLVLDTDSSENRSSNECQQNVEEILSIVLFSYGG